MRTFGLIAAAAVFVAGSNFALADEAPASFAICKGCHGVEAGKDKPTAPNLFGVVGRAPGTDPKFPRYSQAMKDHAKAVPAWTTEALAAYVNDPKKAVPGNTMPFGGVHNDAKAAEIAGYLGTLK